MTVPYSNLPFPQPGQSLQRERRAWREFTDEHGRRFGAFSDIATSQPIGELTPLGCNPPWLPPMRFAKWKKVGDLHFTWDYDTMAAELGGDTAQYYQDAVKFAVENNKPEPEVGGPVDRTIRYVLGPPPLSAALPLAAKLGDAWLLGIKGADVNHELKAVLEQQAGANSQEVLQAIMAKLTASAGASNVPRVPSQPVAEDRPERQKSITDVDASSLPNISYKEFLAACMSRGMSMTDGALAWQEHKKLMDEEAA